MKLVRFWARAFVDEDGAERPDGHFVGHGWSDDSLEAARAHALERARAIARRIARLDEVDEPLPPDSGSYYGSERPMREPIVTELEGPGGRSGVITRNAYGAYILNTVSAAFVDLDVVRKPAGPPPGFVGRLLGRRRPRQPFAEAEAELLERVERVVRERDLGMALYRTRAGFRGLLTDRPRPPTDEAMRDLLEALGSDPLYVRLCRTQACFRARLTPKPWRMGFPSPPVFFPWEEGGRRKRDFEAWSERYDQARVEWSVCRWVKQLGRPELDPEIERVQALHDEWTLGGRALA